MTDPNLNVRRLVAVALEKIGRSTAPRRRFPSWSPDDPTGAPRSLSKRHRLWEIFVLRRPIETANRS